MCYKVFYKHFKKIINMYFTIVILNLMITSTG